MTWYEWLIGGTFVVLVALVGLSFTPAMKSLALRGLRGTKGLPLRADLRANVTRKLMRRVRFSLGGTALGLAVAVTVVRLAVGEVTVIDLYVILAATYLAGAAGVVIAILRQQLARLPGPLSLARLRVVTIGDYVPRAPRIAGWIVVCAVTVTVVTRDAIVIGLHSATARDREQLIASTVIAVLALIGMAVFEFAGRAIVARPQPAGSSEELVWDDALRAASLRDLLVLPVLGGGYGFVYGILRGFTWNDGASSFVLFGLSAVTIVSAFVFLLVLRSDREHYLYRLWPSGPGPDFYAGSEMETDTVETDEMETDEMETDRVETPDRAAARR